MALVERSGDLLAAPDRVIAHGCNAEGKFNKGVAKAIRDRYPDCHRHYVAAHAAGQASPGLVVPWVGADRVVLNCITQARYRRPQDRPGVVYADYDAIRSAMRRIEKAALRHRAEGKGALHGVTSISMPRIGAGLAGGDWDVIRAIIGEELLSLDVTVWSLA